MSAPHSSSSAGGAGPKPDCRAQNRSGDGSVGPAATFAHIHPAGKWLLSILMLLGRLELFTVIVLFSPSFWRE